MTANLSTTSPHRAVTYGTAPTISVPAVELRAFTGTDEQWDALARAHGLVFHSAAWLAMLRDTQPARLERLGIYADGAMVGILPLFVTRMAVLTIAASPAVIDNTPYLGLACPAELHVAAVHAAERYAKREGIHFLRLFQPDMAADDIDAPPYPRTEKHTHVIDLSGGLDEVWKGLHSTCRTGIRKAEKQGVTVERETGPEWIAGHVAMLEGMYEAQHMGMPNARPFYDRLWADFSDRGLYGLTARVEGERIAGGMFLVDGEWAYYLNGCSSPEGNQRQANRAVQWAAIRTAKEMGATYYDFVGSDIPRLAHFKGSFGGDLLTYSLIERASSPWVTMLREGYPLMKHWARAAKRGFRTPKD